VESDRMPQSIYSNNLLSYVSYLVIAKYEEKVGSAPHGLYFNKLMFLCHQNLADKGINIGLPHYWYRYGDQVHKYSMPNNLVWNHENPTETTVEWKYEEPLLLHGRPYDLINKVVSKLTDKYINDEYQIIKDVYNYAPFEFQKKFLNLREIFYGRKAAFNWDEKAYNVLSKSVFLETFSTFPQKDFPTLERSYNIMNKFIETATEKEDWSFDLLQKICTQFWFLFCYHLRLNKKAHENIPKETVSYWESRIEFENTRYRRIIGDLLIQAVENCPEILKDDLLKEEYEWRTNDLEETEIMIDEFYKDFKEFGNPFDS